MPRQTIIYRSETYFEYFYSAVIILKTVYSKLYLLLKNKLMLENLSIRWHFYCDVKQQQ